MNDGRTLKAGVLAGTIPISFSGFKYNIPIETYITEAYPTSSPVLFVRPTSNMIIKPQHQYVDQVSPKTFFSFRYHPHICS